MADIISGMNGGIKMNRTLSLTLSLALAAGTALAGDFTYTQRTEITGGSMKQMMNMLGRFAKGVTEPQTSTVYLKGGKMATHAAKSIAVMDAEAGTMTSIDLDRKEYSVITFEEMVAAMKKMSEKMQGNKQDAEARSSMKVSLDDKGAGRTVAGVATRNLLMKIDTETTVVDKKSGKEVTIQSSIENDMLIGKAEGSEAFREFAKAMEGKFPLQQVPLQAMMQGVIDVDGLKEAGKKMAEVDGLPLFSVTRMINSGTPGMPPPRQSGVREERPTPSAGDAVAGALGGRLGRFGGLGRKAQEAPKKAEPAPEPQPAASAEPQQNVALELTSEVTSFNSGAVNPSVFAVPAGFKEVEHQMKKMAR